MISRRRQSGLGIFGWLFWGGLIGLAALVTIQTYPLLYNHFLFRRAVENVARDAFSTQEEGFELRQALVRRWDVDYINPKIVKPTDVKLKTMAGGRRALVYDYEARANLFYNVYLVLVFKDEVPVRRAAD